MKYYNKFITIKNLNKKLMKLIYNIHNKNITIINYRIDDI